MKKALASFLFLKLCAVVLAADLVNLDKLRLAASQNLAYLPGELVLTLPDRLCEEASKYLDSDFTLNAQVSSVLLEYFPQNARLQRILRQELKAAGRTGECAYTVTYSDFTSLSTQFLVQEHGEFLELQNRLAQHRMAARRQWLIAPPYPAPQTVEISHANQQYVQYQVEAMRVRLVHEQGIVGGPDVPIAFIGTGIDRTHPDLAHNLFESEKFIGQDDRDNIGHETFGAGLACGKGRITGMALSCHIISLKAIERVWVLGEQFDYGTAGSILASLLHLLNNYDRFLIVVMSLSVPEDFPEIAAALAAMEQRFLVFAASGNYGWLQATYPGLYSLSLSNMVTMASVNRDMIMSRFSNIGRGVTLATYGEDIISTFPDGKYAVGSGTSVANHLEAGLAVLAGVAAKRKGWALTPQYLKWTLLRSAYLDDRHAPFFYLLIQNDAVAAINAALNPPLPPRRRGLR
ncbi:MAG: S8 family serine peptidase [Candidatus Doudnabacteria bacterium]|nr:S8 family serine peptidase [Candidatus Doudnabacteria bacterium]